MSTDLMLDARYLSNLSAAYKLKVLVIDDERDLADVTGALLSLHSIPNQVVYSAKEGLQAIEQDTEINAVFSDIMMPEMTGLQMALQIRERHPEVKIILTSGFTPPQILATHAEFCTFTPKPYRIETVIESFIHDFRVDPSRLL
jgi:two-component system OmpR family response regulator